MAALVMIRQNLDDTAFADLAVPALIHHSLKLAAQRLQSRYTTVYLVQMTSGDAVCLMA